KSAQGGWSLPRPVLHGGAGVFLSPTPATRSPASCRAPFFCAGTRRRARETARTQTPPSRAASTDEGRSPRQLRRGGSAEQGFRVFRFLFAGQQLLQALAR